jgi:hypothetical protein
MSHLSPVRHHFLKGGLPGSFSVSADSSELPTYRDEAGTRSLHYVQALAAARDGLNVECWALRGRPNKRMQLAGASGLRNVS